MALQRDKDQDVVKAGTYRLTLASGWVGGLVAILTIFDEHLVDFFGGEVSDGIKASVLIAVIAAWALIVVADLLARAIATAAKLRSSNHEALAVPGGMRVKLTNGVDKPGWTVAAIRRARGRADGEGSDVEFLVLKDGEASQWVDRSGVALEESPPDQGSSAGA